MQRVNAARLFGTAMVLVCGACSEPPATPADATAARLPAGTRLLDREARTIPLEDTQAVVGAFEAAAGEGLSIRRVTSASVDLLIVVIELAQLEPRVEGIDGEGRDGVTAQGVLEDLDTRLVVGSSFVSQLNSLAPVGLLQIDGRVLNPIQPHGYRRVLGVTPEGIGVVGHRAYHAGLFDSAIQAGPGVIEASLLDITERDLQRPRFVRAFIATCGERALAGISLEPVHLFSLGQALLEDPGIAALGCDEVVNLAGDREALLAISNGREAAWLGHPANAKVALITFVARR